MGTFVFKLPDIGEGVVEGEIVKWLVQAGDAIEEDAPLVEVMTDKATVDHSQPASGQGAEDARQEGDHGARCTNRWSTLERWTTRSFRRRNGVQVLRR